MTDLDIARERLPVRYFQPGWTGEFERRLNNTLRPGMTILDLGSGRCPAVPPAHRPDGVTYVGLDLSAAELERAPAGSYDEVHVADAREHRPALDGRFDAVVSFQVLEHVKPLDAAVQNVARYLRPGGRFVTQFSGTFSAFGIINKMVPQKFGVWALKTLLQRDPETVFPAHYHHCYTSALRKMLSGWYSAEIVPIYTGAEYFRFFRPLQSAYLAYENRVAAAGRDDLATHYVVDARR